MEHESPTDGPDMCNKPLNHQDKVSTGIALPNNNSFEPFFPNNVFRHRQQQPNSTNLYFEQPYTKFLRTENNCIFEIFS